MQFTIRDTRGRLEVRQHIPYVVKRTGPVEWSAIDPRDGHLWARSFVSPELLRERCDTCTEHVRYVNEET